MANLPQYDPFNQVCCADCRWWVRLGPESSDLNLCTHPDHQRVESRSPITGKTVYLERNGFDHIEFQLPSPHCRDLNAYGNCSKFEAPTPESDAAPDPPVVSIFRRIITGDR